MEHRISIPGRFIPGGSPGIREGRMSGTIAEEAIVGGETELEARPLTGGALVVAILLSALWGTNPTALKVVLRGFPPIGSAGVRFAIAALGVALWCRATRVRLWPLPGEEVALGVNALFFILQIATFTLGVHWGTAGHSIVLLHTYPLFVVALAHFLIPGDRTTPGKLAGLAMAFGGIVALFAGDWGRWQGTQLQGDVVQVVSAWLLAGQIVWIKHAVARVDSSRLVFWQMATSAAVFIVYSLAAEGLAGTRGGAWPVAAVLYQGLIIGTLCFTVWTWLIRRHAASRVAIFGFVGPLVGVGLSAVVLGEGVTPQLLLASALVAGGIVFASRW